jgi:hypothetical protein
VSSVSGTGSAEIKDFARGLAELVASTDMFVFPEAQTRADCATLPRERLLHGEHWRYALEAYALQGLDQCAIGALDLLAAP